MVEEVTFDNYDEQAQKSRRKSMEKSKIVAAKSDSEKSDFFSGKSSEDCWDDDEDDVD